MAVSNLRFGWTVGFGASVPGAGHSTCSHPHSADTVDRSIGAGTSWRSRRTGPVLLRDVVLNTAMKSAGGTVPAQTAKELTLSEKLIELGCPSHKATSVATKIGSS